MRYLSLIALALPLAAAGCSGCEKKEAPATEPPAAAAATAPAAPAVQPPPAAAAQTPMAPTFMGTGNAAQPAPMPGTKVLPARFVPDSRLKRIPARLMLAPRTRGEAPEATPAKQ